jgi:hypothetical protein
MLDMLQYISAALLIRFWTRSKEKESGRIKRQ